MTTLIRQTRVSLHQLLKQVRMVDYSRANSRHQLASIPKEFHPEFQRDEDLRSAAYVGKWLLNTGALTKSEEHRVEEVITSYRMAVIPERVFQQLCIMVRDIEDGNLMNILLELPTESPRMVVK